MIKASAILAIALFITWLLRRRAAAERHMVWTAAIISAALLPILTLLLPAWQPRLAEQVAATLPRISARSAGTNSLNGPDVIFHADSIEPAVSGLARVWPFVWAAGSLAGLVVFGAGIIKQRRLVSRSGPLSDPVLAEMTVDIAAQLGCKRRLQLTRSFEQSMPMTWGVFRPEILLPNGMDGWPQERKRVVIAHELAHVRRLDWLFHMFARFACAVYWFNPLFWIACNRLDRESERACDDEVINLGVDAHDYATHLFEIARALRQSEGVFSATLAMARQSTLEKRFAALLNRTVNRRAATRETMLVVTAATLFMVLPLGAMRISRDDRAAGASSASPAVDQYTTPPLYSDEARLRAIEGIVTVEVRVGIEGTVQHLQVVRGLGYGLDENALLAVRDWRFVPAMRDGVPIEATASVDVEFNLRNAELNELIANDMATRIGPGVVPPQIVHRVEPQHSSVRRREKPAGAVILDAVIPEDGTPKIVRVIQSLDWEFDEVAIKALQQWRFSPAMKDGRPVKVRMNIAVHFQTD